MRRSFGWLLTLVIAIGLLPSPAGAQEEKQESWKFFKLDFVVRELEGGKTVNTRNYTMMTKSGDWQQLRVGTRVPIVTEESKIQYTDVGLSVDCRILEGPGGSSLVTKADISSFAGSEGEKGAPSSPPLLRHVQMNTSAPITLGKPVVISGVDELNSNHRFQLEVTATELK
ncbi:MAG: hypothetical protein L0191_08540 [Acidobacteria bacterium]|nr:hypothetical protein [Acidobacteriota bacterium]